MKRSLVCFYFFIIVSVPIKSFSQTQGKLDSLLKVLVRTTDTTKINALNAIAQEYLQRKPDSSEYYAQLALTLSESTNFLKGSTEAYFTLGSYFYESDPKLSRENYEKALALCVKRGNKSGMAIVLENLGRLFFKQGEYASSLDYYNKALKINESIGAKKNIVDDYLTIGVIYKDKKKYKEAMDCQQLALKLALEINDEASVAFIYDNIAQIYSAQNPKSLKALEYLLKASEIRERLPGKNSLMAGYNNLGVWFQNAGQFDKAIGYFIKVAVFSEKTNSAIGIAIANNNMGEIYNAMGDYIRAEVCFNKSIQISKEIQYKELLMTSYKGLSETFFNKKDKDRAYSTLLLYMNLKDSLLNETSSKQLAEVQTKYETEKKEMQIASLSKDKEISDATSNKQQILIYSVSLGLLLLLFLTFSSPPQSPHVAAPLASAS